MRRKLLYFNKITIEEYPILLNLHLMSRSNAHQFSLYCVPFSFSLPYSETFRSLFVIPLQMLSLWLFVTHMNNTMQYALNGTFHKVLFFSPKDII